MVGALCCNGIIKNCDKTGFASIAAGTKPVTDNVMSALNGGKGPDQPFTRGLLIFIMPISHQLTSKSSIM